MFMVSVISEVWKESHQRLRGIYGMYNQHREVNLITQFTV